LSNCKVKSITENNILNSEKNITKQFEITFETSEKTGKVQLSGQGKVKATVSV